MRTSPAPALRRLRCLSRVIAKHSHAWARYSCAVQHFPGMRALQRFDASVIVLAQMKIVQALIALACLLAGADAFGVRPEKEKKPDAPPPAFKQYNLWHDGIQTQPATGFSSLLQKYSCLQSTVDDGTWSTQWDASDNSAPAAPARKVGQSHAEQCWEVCQVLFYQHALPHQVPSHAFQDYGGDKTKCICKNTCVCIEAGELPTNANDSPTTLAKLDWQGCTAPPPTIITPQLPTFKQYNAYNAPPPGTMHLCLEDAEDYTAWDAANPNTPYPVGDTAADCWEACKNDGQAEYEVVTAAGGSRCICKRDCFCTEDTQAPTQAPNILAGLDWGGCTAPPTTIITPPAVAFKLYNAWPDISVEHLCLADAEDKTVWDAASNAVTITNPDQQYGTAEDCWEACRADVPYVQAEYMYYGASGSRCICKKNCFCTEVTQAPTQAPNILAGLDWGGCTA